MRRRVLGRYVARRLGLAHGDVALERRRSLCREDRRRRGSGAGSRGGRTIQRIVEHASRLVLHALQTVAEVPQATTQRTSHLGQTLRSKDQQCDHEDQQQVCWLNDVSEHVYPA